MTFDLGSYLSERRQLVDQALDLSLPAVTSDPARLNEAIRYSIFCGGKRLRPILALATADTLGCDPHDVLPLGCAIECIHTFSLIHDDLPAIDNDDLRRGNPTNHIIYGEAMAILAGDALLAMAFELMGQCRKSFPDARVLDAIIMVSAASGTHGMVGGQVADIEAEGASDVDEPTVASIHARKTGALLMTSILASARMCGATPEQEKALGEYGDQIGLAFQITDDVLDLEGDAEKIGKTVGSDLKQDKATYPKVIGIPASRALADRSAAEAIRALDQFGPSADPLRALARYVVEREG